MKYGYVPTDLEPSQSFPKETVEYAFDDCTIARMAEKMGKADIAKILCTRSVLPQCV